MRTSIATVSVSGTLPERIAAIAAAGFDGLELFEQDLLVTDETPAAVRRMIEDHGLALTLYQPFRDFETLPEPCRAAAFDRAERKFDLMHELGADLMLVCSSVAPQALGGIDRAAADFRELGEWAARPQGRLRGAVLGGVTAMSATAPSTRRSGSPPRSDSSPRPRFRGRRNEDLRMTIRESSDDTTAVCCLRKRIGR